MGGAVDMCSGLGACRKKLDGTMCPSYMATREEAHSTRGRANVLRLAMAGRLGEAGPRRRGRARGARSVPRVPRLQGRVPGRRRRGAVQERVPRRLLAAARHAAASARARPRPRAVARGAARSRRVANCVARSAPVALAERAAARPRSPPRCRRRGRRTRSRAGSRGRHARRPTARAVAALQRHVHELLQPGDRPGGADVLESRRHARSGLAPNGCCGRPLISQGLLDEARRARRRRTSSGCIRWPPRARRFVFFEPSCLSALREDAPDLLRGDAQRSARRRVAQACVLFEEFLEQQWQEGRAR